MKLDVAGPVANHRTVAHGGIYSQNRQFDPAIIDFSSNVNPLGFPPSARRLLRESQGLISLYPDSDSNLLRKRLEKYTGVPSGQITVGNGATEILYNFCKAFLVGRRTLVPIPTFGEYEAAARLGGARMGYFKTMNLNDDIGDFLSEIPRYGCVLVCNPNNPTGVLAKRKVLDSILDDSRQRSSLVFVDECFIELASSPGETVVSRIRKFDNLFILRSMTKSFGLAGLRVGYGLGSRRMAEVLNRIKIPWNVGGVSQKIAAGVLPARSYLQRTRKLVGRERAYLTRSISRIGGLRCYGSEANFILIRSEAGSGRLQRRLLEKKILVRDCSSFRGLDGRFVRIAVRTRNENRKLVRELERL